MAATKSTAAANINVLVKIGYISGGDRHGFEVNEV